MSQDQDCSKEDLKPESIHIPNSEDYFDQRVYPSFQPNSQVYKMIMDLIQLFKQESSLYTIKKHQVFMECFIDIQQFMENFESKKINSFTLEPKLWASAIGLALHQILKKRIVVRIFNYPNEVAIRQLRSHDIGHFVAVKALILSTKTVRLLVLKGKFNCTDCSHQQVIPTNDGIVVAPKQCEECSSQSIVLDRSDSITTLHQRILVQEVANNDSDLQSVGRMPLTIEVELRDNLPYSFRSGEHILINGILMAEGDEQKNQQGKNQNGIYSKYILASTIFEIGNDMDHVLGESDYTFSNEENHFVESVIKSGNMFATLIKSLCPTIFGQELVKAGILLSITGGDQSSAECRNNCHCLIIGDPGQGKSQLLKFVSLIAPKAIYVSGTGTSSCGLTCSVNRRDDDQGNVDAGALVLADNGICCIDEFDKMQNEHSALLEAMEQQTVTIAKSGTLCQFQARTSVLASANPNQGHYVKSKTFLENIKIQNSVLSRFDLIFLMLDHPDPQRDEKLSAHILRLHNPVKRNASQFQNSQYPEVKQQVSNIKFINPLSVFKGKTITTKQQNQKYVFNQAFKENLESHQKVCAFERLTPQAGKLLQDYYIKLRQSSVLNAASLPITTRQFESLIRLSQAKAKLDFRDEVSEADAQFVIQLVEESKFECFMDFDDGMSVGGRNRKLVVDKNNVSTLSKPKQTAIFLEALFNKAKNQNSFIFSVDEMRDEARRINMQVGDFGEFLNQLNFKGIIIKKEEGKYELKYNLL